MIARRLTARIRRATVEEEGGTMFSLYRYVEYDAVGAVVKTDEVSLATIILLAQRQHFRRDPHVTKPGMLAFTSDHGNRIHVFDRMR
jgi:hypothetical protein